MNARQHEKEVLVDYMERFKQEKIIVKSLIGENFLDGFVKTNRQFKKLDEMNDAEEGIEMKKMSLKHVQ